MNDIKDWEYRQKVVEYTMTKYYNNNESDCFKRYPCTEFLMSCRNILLFDLLHIIFDYFYDSWYACRAHGFTGSCKYIFQLSEYEINFLKYYLYGDIKFNSYFEKMCYPSNKLSICSYEISPSFNSFDNDDCRNTFHLSIGKNEIAIIYDDYFKVFSKKLFERKKESLKEILKTYFKKYIKKCKKYKKCPSNKFQQILSKMDSNTIFCYYNS